MPLLAQTHHEASEALFSHQPLHQLPARMVLAFQPKINRETEWEIKTTLYPNLNLNMAFPLFI